MTGTNHNMKTTVTVLALIGAVGGAVSTTSAHAHATFNIAGYGDGAAGSINGNDGTPGTDAGGVWTNGGVGYTGALPVMWYAGMHSATSTRTIETGTPTSANGNSLQRQIADFNASNDSDLPTDRMLRVGGSSWSDPANGGQGWGHGLDFGLIHWSCGGSVQGCLDAGISGFKLTLADDLADGGANLKLGYALYGGWDRGSEAFRHDTFVTSPVPVSNPLGSNDLTLIGWGVASAVGETLSQTFDLNTHHGGEYTVIIGALGGVDGNYQLTIEPVVQPVPIPAAVWLFGSALVGVVTIGWRAPRPTAT
ncbi:conserved exported protein of unknown function [Methylocaldum szegediense]|uniref:Uncharacterized protein n=2 Tax=Methylocaldum szegediense TaxID=73780 RepID=A0ABN8WZX5_9GAMM|nr:conserved exported protein of unknown function [Methylocaldum szegediense]